MEKRKVKKIKHHLTRHYHRVKSRAWWLPRVIAIISVWSLIFMVAAPSAWTFSDEQIVFREANTEIPIAPYPVKQTLPVPQLSAKSFLVVDVDSAVVLTSKDPDTKLNPASLTKLMTALVALDYYQPTSELTVRRLAPEPGEVEMGLAVGDRLTVDNLLYGLLVPSGNDAAFALADNYFGGIENFVFAMNTKAKQLHMENTRFVNPNGTDHPNHKSSARDLLILTKTAMKNADIKRIVATNGITVADALGIKSYPLKNVNQLLGIVPGLEGVKTGYTDLAGQCLITATRRNGHVIYTLVLGSTDRFGESSILIDWAFKNTRWEDIDLLD